MVTKTRVAAQCFSHNTQKTITGPAAKHLRELLFPDNNSFFMESLMDLCHGASFVRLDGFVWQSKQDTKKWIYHRVKSYEDFVNAHFKNNKIFMNNPRKFDVMKYMEVVDHESFPFLKRDVDYIGFDNCLVNIVTYDVIIDPACTVVPRHNLAGSFAWDNVATPCFDSLVQHQLGDGEVYTYFLAFIGRLLYKLKRFDNYNIVPLIKGDAGTGKSTILTILRKIFSPGAVGVLNSNNEVTFGLEAKYNKEVLIAHEIDDHLTDRLSSDLFKQMVCGEDISIPRKNKSAIDVTWGVPMFLCSNVHLSYVDSQGSISRRLAIFKFDKYVENKDVTLEARIVESELPAILAKCLKAYGSMISEIGSKSFWEVCPSYFHENTREMSEQTDYIYMFLTLAPGDNVYGNKDVYFMKKQSSSMLLQDFKNKFLNYMRFRHPGAKYR